MAFVIPNFNLPVGIWNDPDIYGVDPPTLTGLGALMHPKKNVYDTSAGAQLGNQDIGMYLLLPALTDIRDFINVAGINSVVEVPLGSGRVYSVNNVDDVAKGYANEYRLAIIQKVAGLWWPVPIP